MSPKELQKHNALPEEFYRELAERYVEIMLQDGFRGVTSKLAAEYGISTKTMYSRIKAARQYGFLEPYKARQCYRCEQPVVRPGVELPALEEFAADHKEVCEKLAAVAEEEGKHSLAYQLRKAAKHFDSAYEHIMQALQKD